MFRPLRLYSMCRDRSLIVLTCSNPSDANIHFKCSNGFTDRKKQSQWIVLPAASLLVGGAAYFAWRKYHTSTIVTAATVPISHLENKPSPNNTPSNAPRMITPEELAKHRAKEDGGIWVSFRGKVYDVTEFADIHPGGDKILLAAGSDVAPYWSMYAFHYDEHVLELLKEYYIGDLTVTTEVHDHLSEHGPYAHEPERHPALVTVSRAPRNAETPPELIPDHPITPNQLFFVRNHLPVPDIKPEEYELEIHSPSFQGKKEKNEFRLNLNSIKQNFTEHKLISTIICAGLRRTDMVHEDSLAAKAEGRKPLIHGLAWKQAALSTAEWTGVLLVDVLAEHLIPEGQPRDYKHFLEAARKAGIKHIQFVGADADPTVGRFGSSLPIEWALDPDKEVLLAFAMNGAPLSRDQGFPLRVVVPGSIGARQVKWVSQIILSSEESPSYWFQEDYKLGQTTADGTPPDYSKLPPIYDSPVQSAICEPVDGHTIHNYGSVTVKGYAYSGGGRGILSVRVSSDGGRTWHEAQLEPVSPPVGVDPSTLAEGDLALQYRTSRQWAWTLWQAEIPVPDDATEMELLCCARDSSNATQPETCKASMNVRGLLSNNWHRIRIKVRPKGE